MYELRQVAPNKLAVVFVPPAPLSPTPCHSGSGLDRDHNALKAAIASRLDRHPALATIGASLR